MAINTGEGEMDTWHYHCEIVTMDDMLKPDRLNELGDIGWELITVKRIEGKSTWLLVFKKLLP